MASLAVPAASSTSTTGLSTAHSTAKTLSVGIGCRSHTSAAQIEAAVRVALGTHGFDDIATIASIDHKADEAGLLEFCSRHALRLRLFSRAEIDTVTAQVATEPAPGATSAVRAHLGVDGVCEPCALLGAAPEYEAGDRTGTARLIVRKTVHGGVTVAIATNSAHSGSNIASNNSNIDRQDLS
nr:cobalamin biosynthesis protein [Paraburkholderia sp. BCC1886]